MKFSRLLPLCAGLMFTACSSQYDKPDGSYEYLEIPETERLETPGSLAIQEPTNTYAVPEVSVSSEGRVYLGGQVSIRPPRQLLAVAPGSRVEENTAESVIYIDTVEGISDLRGAVWQHMLDVVETYNVSYTRDPANNRIVTERFTINQHERKKPGLANLISREMIVTESEQAFEITFSVASHGRSGALSATVIEPLWIVDGQSRQVPMNFDRMLESDVLNEISSALERSYRSNRDVFAERNIEVTLGKSANNDPAFIMNTDFNNGWVLFPEVLSELGFEIADLNQSEGVYYTTYEPFAERSWFSRLAFWRKDETGALGIDEGSRVRFLLDDRDGQVFIIPMIGDEPLTETQGQNWYPLVVEAFRNGRNQ